MDRRFQEERERHGSGRISLLCALLPALLCASPLGGASAWLHAHGEAGSHVHVVTADADPADPGALHEWHELRHLGHEEGLHDHERGEEPAPAAPAAPRGIRIDLPQALAATPRGPHQPFDASVVLLAVDLAPRWSLDVVESVHRPALRLSGWPPQHAERSTIVELLRSSHALLI